jgi:hypothetical protein
MSLSPKAPFPDRDVFYVAHPIAPFRLSEERCGVDSCGPAHFGLSACPSMSLNSHWLHSTVKSPLRTNEAWLIDLAAFEIGMIQWDGEGIPVYAATALALFGDRFHDL